ncbi:MAG TPA: acetyl-CoA C-acyltransferase [Actinomycetota bacterium]|jgi:acetyl-CoA acetyltransferase family protein|nr:acetyl-CoA C-acyltransferase [Actinomycetota bacterium]
MREAVIVEAVRTPVGRRNGRLSGWHPVDLLAEILGAAMERTGIDPARVDDHITGCVSQTGEQAINIGRNGWLAAGLPEEVPSTTIDRQCGSSQQAAHFAAQGVIAGAYDLVIASGIEHMTRVPLGITMTQGPGVPFSQGLLDRYESGLVPQGVSAEIIAEKWNLSRRELDEFGLRSHRLAGAAIRDGRFDGEIHPVKVEGPDGTELFEHDEGVRYDTSIEKMAELATPFKEGGVVTAGNSSQISDGAGAVVIASPETADALGLRPRARFLSFALSGVDPITMLTGPIAATAKALERAGLELGSIDVVEINEAFASVVLAWKKELRIPDDWFEEHVNPNGGAIALGHPLGASGARLMTSLLHELERREGRYGLQTMCEGGGMANATIIERL